MVIKNLENKIKLVLIICSLFLLGCIIISIEPSKALTANGKACQVSSVPCSLVMAVT